MPFEIPQGDKKATYVQGKFSKIAEKYDLFNDLITQGAHRYWKNFVVKRCKLNQGDTALDLCCGTGDIARRLKREVGKDGRVLGIDFSGDMLKVARSRNSDNHVLLAQGDAMRVPVKDNTLNAVTIGFGLRNLVNLDACLEETFRALKPGGRFINLDMGKVKLPIIKQLFHFYFFAVVPRIGKIIYPKESFFDYFPASSLKYPSQELLAEKLRQVGFENVSYKNFYFGSTAIHIAVKPN